MLRRAEEKGSVSNADELRAKAAHYRELAVMLDPETAQLCRDLATQYEQEALDGEAVPDGLSDILTPPQNRSS